MVREEDETKIYVVLCLLAIAILVVNVYTLNVVLDSREDKYQTHIIVLYLEDDNYSYFEGRVIDYVCDDNVHVTLISHWWRGGENDYFYASTWSDGKIPHSNGDCAIKVKELKQ